MFSFLQEFITIDFDPHLGEIGFEYSRFEVIEVKENTQASMHGLQIGRKMRYIDNLTYEPGEFSAKLNEKINSKQKFQITFDMNVTIFLFSTCIFSIKSN